MRDVLFILWCCSFFPYHTFRVSVPCCEVRHNFSEKTMLFFVLTLICFVKGSCLFMLLVVIYVYRCPTRFPYQIMFVSVITTGHVPIVEEELPTVPEYMSHEFISRAVLLNR